ncbi:MAG: peptide chain release factor N(5)-glutamine methyltransferase [Bacteroidales bacterium]|nr:peptide chain release factor N(5)-glutamine methyltransferase [Bacteroidales bacterium]
MTAIIIKTLFRGSGISIYAFPETHVTAKQARRIKEICRELKTGKPLQYVLGETSFYNCSIRVNEAVLIPRPETEELVDFIIKDNRGYRGRIVDLGTGSGAIAIALAVNLPGSKVTGTDISQEALEVARKNAALNSAEVSFLNEDILDPSPALLNMTGLIVSNPPYVRTSEKKHMSKNVTDFEPHQALFVPDSDPLIFYIAALKIASRALLPGGKIYFEINEAMGPEMIDLLTAYGFREIELRQDLNGKDRIIKGGING